MVYKSKRLIFTKNHYAFKTPKWWDCQWRRVACGKDLCKLCGRLNKRRKYHLEKGEDPDSIESAMSDVHNSFEETFELLHKGAKKFGIDLNNLKEVEEEERPDHETYPIYNHIFAWYKNILKLSKEASSGYQVWLKSEAGQDLLWYPSILLVKTARQLDNIWEDQHGDDHAKVDGEYVRYVLKESVSILKRALTNLANARSSQKVDFTFLLHDLKKIETEILSL